MGKRVIAAIRTDGTLPPLYLLGFRDDGAAWVCRWTLSRAHARWFDAEEAEIEAKMLARHHAGWRVLSPEPVGA